ncbi:MAG TPA: hypothetical protein VEW93_02030 [Acidimicrobiales bacterium]|nr:hypothetical protein [Acidimicrobiales bacterium]
MELADQAPDPPWDPWAALRARPHVELRFAPEAALTGGAMLVSGPGRAIVVLDPALDRRARRCALAHELVHEERGGGCDGHGLPEWLDDVVARDEAAVNREVAIRLVPRRALQHLVEQRGGLGEGVAPWEVADAFDVDDTVAALALSLLAAAPA